MIRRRLFFKIAASTNSEGEDDSDGKIAEDGGDCGVVGAGLDSSHPHPLLNIDCDVAIQKRQIRQLRRAL